MIKPASVCYKFGEYIIYLNISLLKQGEFIPLPPKELRVLSCLVENAGKVVNKETLFQYAWGDACVADESLTRCIWALRQVLGDNYQKKGIRTIYSQGYYFTYEVEKCLVHEVESRIPRSLPPTVHTSSALPHNSDVGMVDDLFLLKSLFAMRSRRELHHPEKNAAYGREIYRSLYY